MELIATPQAIKDVMEHGTLEQLDSICHPGFIGSMFHSYSMKFVIVLSRIGIFTFKELKDAYDKCQRKELSASARERQIVLGHYTLYMDYLKKSEEAFSKLSEEDKLKCKDLLAFEYEKS